MVKLRRRMLLGLLGLLALLTPAAAPASNDPFFHEQWGLHRIRAPEAWSVSQGEGVVVAVLDTGVDLTHPDLAGALTRRDDGSVLGYDFVDGDDDPTDEHGHGTMVAGIIAARTANGTGVASVAPRARIMPVRVLDAEGLGTKSSVEEGIHWAVDHGADVVNLSLEIARSRSGGSGRTGPVAASRDRVVRYAWSRGVVIVAAAGNDSADFTDYPTGSPVVVVGATNESDERADFSDAGRVDAVMAPGANILSTWCSPCGSSAEHNIRRSEGTSYAAAHATGAVVLLRAAGFSPSAALNRLRQTAKDIGPPGPDSRTGHGRIDAAAALALPARGPGDLTGGTDRIAEQADEAHPPGTGRVPATVREPPATRPAGALARSAVEPTAVRKGQTPGSVRSWSLLAAALLVIDIAALWWVTAHDELAHKALMLVTTLWRRGVDFVRLLRS